MPEAKIQFVPLCFVPIRVVIVVAKLRSLFSAGAISFKASNVTRAELAKLATALETYVCVAYDDRSIDRVLDIECNDKGRRTLISFAWYLFPESVLL